MFDHVTIRVTDRAASERFYDPVLRPLAIDQSYRTNAFSEWREFSLAGANAENPATRRLHVAFSAPSDEHVDEFWRVGVEAGYRDDGRPGPRPQYSEDYYGAFLLDPDGNSAEAVHDSKPNRSITAAITPPMCSIPTATTSRSSTTTGTSRWRRLEA